MAKKKTKKRTTAEIVASLCAIVFGGLMVLPMFLSVATTESFIGLNGNHGLFDMSKFNETLGTITMIIAMIAIACLVAIAVLSLLNLLGLKLPVLGKILSVIGILATIAGFILMIVYVGDISVLIKYSLGISAYLFLAFGLIGGISGFIANK